MIPGTIHGTDTLTPTDILPGEQILEPKGNGRRGQRAAVSTRRKAPQETR